MVVVTGQRDQALINAWLCCSGMQDLDYTFILQALDELPFNVGKNTLLDVLVGAVNKKMVSNDTYMDLAVYGSLESVDRKQIEQWFERLVVNGYVAYTSPADHPRWKLCCLTPKGRAELVNPALHESRLEPSYEADEVDAESQRLIDEFSFFLEDFTPAQRHAIVTPKKRVLCVAGAGTGKTTVLTNRVRFLAKYRGVAASDVLAITFTRKAREEMQHRLSDVGAQVLTFNGFCERLLRARGLSKPLVTYGQKMSLFREALKLEELDVRQLVFEYFTPGQRNGKSREELSRRLMGDVYSILDHYSNADERIPKQGDSELATTLLSLAKRISELMESRGVRDFSGQLSEALALLRSDSSAIPQFSHVLVDEYQDVNVAQQELLDLLDADNLFVVGDPRQSIFGWRGSEVRFITEFAGDCVVQLRRNFRSCEEIVRVSNACISHMGLPDLVAHSSEAGVVQALKYSSEDEEVRSVASLVSNLQSDEVFVLARTNRQLDELSVELSRLGVSHVVRREDDSEVASGVVLSTVHAIKGLEAQAVVVVGCTSKFFPCKVSDHPVIDLLKGSGLDREEEERRLLYVALSRAKQSLVLTYAGSPSYLLDGVLSSGSSSVQQRSLAGRDDSLYERLRSWRSEVARSKGLPAYCVCSDKTLRELSELKPSDASSLLSVYGLGPSKVEEFGDDLLALLS